MQKDDFLSEMLAFISMFLLSGLVYNYQNRSANTLQKVFRNRATDHAVSISVKPNGSC